MNSSWDGSPCAIRIYDCSEKLGIDVGGAFAGCESCEGGGCAGVDSGAG